MQPIFEHRLELAKATTRALELDGEGPPLLFLHGFGDSADTWRYTLDVLRRRGRRGLAVDLPGFGTASRLDRDREVLPQLDAFVDAAVRYLAREGEEVIVVGNSLGGCLSLRAAERKLPIAAIVPVAPAGLDMARWFAIIEREFLVRAILRSPVPLPEVVVREAVGRVYRVLAFAPSSKIDPRVVTAFTSHIATRGDVSRMMDTAKRILPELRDAFDLERISCPVLLVWGDRDRLVFTTGADRVLAAVPNSRIEVFKGCGHCPQIEVPERFVDELERFVKAPLAAAA